MRLPWQSEMTGTVGDGAGTQEVAPTRVRRWRRVLAGTRRGAAGTAPVAPFPPPEQLDAARPDLAPEADAPGPTTGGAAHPGIVAIAIARMLIAIDFALGGPGSRPRR